MELERSRRPGDDDVGFAGGGADRARRATGSSTTDRKICSTDRGWRRWSLFRGIVGGGMRGRRWSSRSAAAAAAPNDHQNLPASTIIAVDARANSRENKALAKQPPLLELFYKE